MKTAGSMALFALALFGQAAPTPGPSRLETSATAPGVHILWSSPAGQLASGDVRAIFTAIAVKPAGHDAPPLRGLRVELAQGSEKHTLYVEEADVRTLESKITQMDKSTKHLAADSDITYSTQNPEDDAAAKMPLSFAYHLRRSKAPQLRLDGPGLPPLEFVNTKPSDVAAIFSRAVKALESR